MLDLTKHAVTRLRGSLVYTREVAVRAAPDRVFAEVAAIGGERGWPFANFLWRWRGHIDRLLGGVGMRRPRRDPDQLRIGDVVDFWRVEALRPGRLIRFLAEMKLPGEAWLQFEFLPLASGETLLRAAAVFKPRGFWGILYWVALYPVHVFLFGGMLRALADTTERRPARTMAISHS
jgi:hypothetical protein